MMRTIVKLAVAGVVVVSAFGIAEAQTRRGTAPQQRTQTTTTTNSYGLPDCSQRPFARECDRRGTW